jgi:hypothetical protein
VFVFLIGAAFAGYHSRWLSRAAAQPASAADMFADLPANTSPAAIYIDVKALRAAPFFTKLAAMAPDAKTDAEYSAFVAATGFHYETDLDQIAVVTTASTPSNSAQVIVQGRFDEQKIAAYTQTHGKVRSKDGHSAYEFPMDNPARSVSVEFLSPNRLRVTSLASGGATSDTAASSADATSTPIAMRDHISRLSDSAFFAVFHVDNLKGMNATNVGPISSPQVSAVLHSIQWVTLTGNPEAGNLRLAIEAECDDAGKAQQLSSGLIALKSMAPMFLNQPNAQQQIPADAQRAISDLISSSQVTTTDTRVKFSLVLSQGMLDVMSSAAKARAQAGR